MSTNWLLNDHAEEKGKQELYTRQSPQLLKALKEMTFVQSVESSNRIEGVTVAPDRLRPLVLGHAHSGSVGQCKCYKEFEDRDLRKAADSFWKPLKFWNTENIKAFRLYVASSSAIHLHSLVRLGLEVACQRGQPKGRCSFGGATSA